MLVTSTFGLSGTGLFGPGSGLASA